jgi:hypothetical protein|uniref:Uncharacterized protein n=1 Tax=Siphoviridae sp. ctHip2 TaxID=2827830 RepID=A0A8S5RVZ6_9CAUD|nr:MAG TPA: hypothetical protein [Siphoviridae sp. ctHip2]
MNTIVENKSKLDKLVQDGYKIIYPNSIDGLDFEVITEEWFTTAGLMETHYVIEKSLNCSALSLYEKFFKYKNDLFLNFSTLITSKFGDCSDKKHILRFGKSDAKKEFKIRKLLIVSDSMEFKLGDYPKFQEKINFILFDPKNLYLVFYIDDKFKSKEAQKEDLEKNKKQNLENELEEDLQSLFD